MSLRIIKAGLMDTIQDGGRWGHACLGVNPGGSMDRMAAYRINALLGKDLNAPVLEMHFPPATMEFTKPAIIAIGGADCSPRIDGDPVQRFQPIHVKAGAKLEWGKPVEGRWCYLGVTPELKLQEWLGSF